MKVQKGKKRGPATSEPRSGKAKIAVTVRKTGERRAGNATLSRKNSGRGNEGNAKRTVDLPRLSDLRITISNEKARLLFALLEAHTRRALLASA